MRIKRICAAILAVVISAGTFAVPAFAFTDESAAADTTVVQDAVPAGNAEEGTRADENTETDVAEPEDEADTSLAKLLADSELLAMILPELDEETINFLIEHPKLVAMFIPTLHVTVTDHSVIVSVGDETEEPAKQTGTVTTNGSCLNVRNGASTDYDIIGQLSNGSGVTIKGEKDGWYQIEFPAEFAYVCGQYVKVNEIPTKETVEGTTFDIDGRTILTFLKALEEVFPETPVIESHGLTPSGNLTLVDDIGSRTGEGQQFVTMVTRSGNYYYLIIDRDEKGNENVHFLNQVDEADLFSLMDEDAAEAMREQLAAEEAARQAAQNPTVAPTEPQETTEPEPEPEKQQSKAPYAMALVVIIVVGGVGAFFFMKNRKQKEAAADRPDPDADYREDDDGYDIPEETDEEEYDESEGE